MIEIKGCIIVSIKHDRDKRLHHSINETFHPNILQGRISKISNHFIFDPNFYMYLLKYQN